MLAKDYADEVSIEVILTDDKANAFRKAVADARKGSINLKEGERMNFIMRGGNAEEYVI